MQRSRTDASCVRSVDYNAAQATLEIAYGSGAVDRYFGVPPDIVDALEAAPSRGTFVVTVLKPRYRCDRLTPSRRAFTWRTPRMRTARAGRGETM